MDKRTELNNALKEAMKNKDQVALSTVRLILAGIKDRDIAARTAGAGEGITDADILSLLQSMIKQRGESTETYRKAGREDLAAREEAEIAVLKSFLPKQMTESDVKAAIDGLIAELKIADIKDMGRLMAEMKTRYAGQMDMSKVSGLVREKLAG